MQDSIRIVPVVVDGNTFCFDNRNVLSVSQGTICQLMDTPLPGGIVGSITRGENEVPVFSVRQLFGCETELPIEKTNLIIAATALGECGFLVDDVLRGREAISLAPFPRVAVSKDQAFYCGIVRWQQDSSTTATTMLLDVEGLVGESQYSGPQFSPQVDEAVRGNFGGARSKGQLMLFDLPHVDWDNQVVSIALSVTQVLEVAKPEELIRIPLAPDNFLGFINWRQYAVPVVNLPEEMQLGTVPEAASNRIVVARTEQNELVGFYSCNSIRTLSLPVEATPFVMGQVSKSTAVRATYLTNDGVFVVPNLELSTSTSA